MHNGIDVGAYTYRAHKDDYLIYIGARTPTKHQSNDPHRGNRTAAKMS